MQFQFGLDSIEAERHAVRSIPIGVRQVPIAFVRNARARRYVLRVRRDGIIRVTIPRGGSMLAARSFVDRHTSWIERQFRRIETETLEPLPWTLGTEVLFRGNPVRLEAGEILNFVKLGSEAFRVLDLQLDLRREVEHHLRHLANRELPARVFELARADRLVVQQVTVRNQRSRWGSCSRRGTISLNWRLIQTPDAVRDYIVLHELMHLREMNHSKRFWREVERVCPHYKESERWLKAHAKLLR